MQTLSRISISISLFLSIILHAFSLSYAHSFFSSDANFLPKEKQAVALAQKVFRCKAKKPYDYVDLGEELRKNESFLRACATIRRLCRTKQIKAAFANTTIRTKRVPLRKPTDSEIKRDGKPCRALLELWENEEWKEAVDTYIGSVDSAVKAVFGSEWTVIDFGDIGPHVLWATSETSSQRSHLDAMLFFLSGQHIVYFYCCFSSLCLLLFISFVNWYFTY